MWFISDRRHREELAAARAEADRLRTERDAALEDTSAAKAAAKTAACLFKEADEKYVDVCIVNELLTTDLTAAREKLAEFDGRRTVAGVLEEYDVHRKALADALGEQKRHLGWDALIGEVGGLAGVVAGLQKRVAHLEKELDNACGMPPDGLLDSAPWQPGYKAPIPDTKASMP